MGYFNQQKIIAITPDALKWPIFLASAQTDLLKGLHSKAFGVKKMFTRVNNRCFLGCFSEVRNLNLNNQ
jgi:hypothetical protein